MPGSKHFNLGKSKKNYISCIKTEISQCLYIFSLGLNASFNIGKCHLEQNKTSASTTWIIVLNRYKLTCTVYLVYKSIWRFIFLQNSQNKYSLVLKTKTNILILYTRLSYTILDEQIEIGFTEPISIKNYILRIINILFLC